MRKNLGLFGVVMVAVFLAASLIVPATASAFSTADTVNDLIVDQGAFSVVRSAFYEAYGYGMTPGGAGSTTGGDLIINFLSGYGLMTLDQIASIGLFPELNPLMPEIAAGLAAYVPGSQDCPVGPDCWTYDFSTIAQLYGDTVSHGAFLPDGSPNPDYMPGYSTPQWDVLVGVLGEEFADYLAGWVEGLRSFTLYDMGTGYPEEILGYHEDILVYEAPLDAAWAELCVPVPATIFLLGGGLMGLIGTRRFKKQ